MLFFIFALTKCGSSSVGRAPAFQAGCREFEPRLPLQNPKSKDLGFFYFPRKDKSVSGFNSFVG